MTFAQPRDRFEMNKIEMDVFRWFLQIKSHTGHLCFFFETGPTLKFKVDTKYFFEIENKLESHHNIDKEIPTKNICKQMAQAIISLTFSHIFQGCPGGLSKSKCHLILGVKTRFLSLDRCLMKTENHCYISDWHHPILRGRQAEVVLEVSPAPAPGNHLLHPLAGLKRKAQQRQL